VSAPREVIVLRGVSGSGKSTYAARRAAQSRAGARVAIVSADDFFVGEDGGYTFAPEKLSLAHGACFREFMANITLEVETIIVDNTGGSASEIAPYLLAASAYGYEAEVHQIVCDVALASERNVHGVPTARVEAMARAIAGESLPPWWKVKLVE
jgi:predicted ABC-type ATPase